MLNGGRPGHWALQTRCIADLRFAADNTGLYTAFHARADWRDGSQRMCRALSVCQRADILRSARRVLERRGAEDRSRHRLYPPDPNARADLCLRARLADFVSPRRASPYQAAASMCVQTLAKHHPTPNREMAIALHGSDFREGGASFMESGRAVYGNIDELQARPLLAGAVFALAVRRRQPCLLRLR